MESSRSASATEQIMTKAIGGCLKTQTKTSKETPKLKVFGRKTFHLMLSGNREQ